MPILGAGPVQRQQGGRVRAKIRQQGASHGCLLKMGKPWSLGPKLAGPLLANGGRAAGVRGLVGPSHRCSLWQAGRQAGRVVAAARRLPRCACCRHSVVSRCCLSEFPPAPQEAACQLDEACQSHQQACIHARHHCTGAWGRGSTLACSASKQRVHAACRLVGACRCWSWPGWLWWLGCLGWKACMWWVVGRPGQLLLRPPLLPLAIWCSSSVPAGTHLPSRSNGTGRLQPL